MQQKFFITPWAATGDRTSPPNSQQPDGSVSYSQGFGPDYEADPATDPNAKPVPREETNGVYFDLTDAVGALQRTGVPEFITAADNGGTAFAYQRGALVRWSADGNPPHAVYTSRVNGNTALPSNAANWAPFVFEAATNAEAVAGTRPDVLITPPGLAAALAAASVSVPDASTTIKGIQRNATNAEAQAGSLASATITPASLASALGAYSFNASQVASGTLAAARIPSLPASQIGSGVFDPARIPAVNIDASQVATGVLPVARGGTGAASWDPLSFLQVAGTGTTFLARTPEQTRVQIGAASLEANTFTGEQTVQHPSVPRTVYRTPDTVFGDIRARAGGMAIVAESGSIWLRPNGGSSSAGEVVLAPSGNMTVGGSVTASGGFQGSSRTVKTDDAECPYGLDHVMLMDARSFRYLPEYRDDGDRRSLGFYAEDLRAVLPELVRESDGPSPLVVEYDQLFPVLVRAIQQQTETIAALEDRITRLEATRE